MAFGFVHLSDIHFGQEDGKGQVHINDDVKDQLVEDVRSLAAKLESGRAAGIIVTGDIAYSGLREEYDLAAAWLDRVAEAAGCDRTEIQVVPGNHDIDRTKITALGRYSLEQLSTRGQDALDELLKNPEDRAVLYLRFQDFLPFAEAYRCPLDLNAQPAEERILELAPGKSLRFVRLNSALCCADRTSAEEEGKLFLGAAQRVLKKRHGEELVVLMHHPTNWLLDSEDTVRYLQSRARVLITGHEHNPSVVVENTEEGCDLMRLAAGATVPPKISEKYNYCYNIIEFSLDEQINSLKVHILPRTWNDQKKRFEADEKQLDGSGGTYILGCPNFRSQSDTSDEKKPQSRDVASQSETVSLNESPISSSPVEGRTMQSYSLLLLRFFRDISKAERIGILAEFGAIPPDVESNIGEAIMRSAFDSIFQSGRQAELQEALDRLTGK